MKKSGIHDRNVRVVPRSDAPDARTSWRSRLARMLLNRALGVACLAALLLSMPACVIPVGPDFQDPVSSPQVAPWIHDQSPSFGQTISVLANKPAVTFSVQVTDLNAADKLYRRWVVNPPSASNDSTLETVTLTPQGMEEIQKSLPTVAEVQINIGCSADSWKSNPLAQQLELIVADGEFTGDIDMVDPLKTRKSYANWTIALECSSTAGASP